MIEKYFPSKGDIIYINFNPQKGSEQAGFRPALVISPTAYNKKTGLAICCSITTKVKNYPFEVALNQQRKVKGVVLADQLKNLDWQARGAKFIEKARPEVLNATLLKALELFINK